METTLPTMDTIQEIESRQEEVLRKLDELEKRIAQTLAQFGDPRFIKSAGVGIQNAESSIGVVQPLAKAA